MSSRGDTGIAKKFQHQLHGVFSLEPNSIVRAYLSRGEFDVLTEKSLDSVTKLAEKQAERHSALTNVYVQPCIVIGEHPSVRKSDSSSKKILEDKIAGLEKENSQLKDENLSLQDANKMFEDQSAAKDTKEDHEEYWGLLQMFVEDIHSQVSKQNDVLSQLRQKTQNELSDFNEIYSKYAHLQVAVKQTIASLPDCPEKSALETAVAAIEPHRNHVQKNALERIRPQEILSAESLPQVSEAFLAEYEAYKKECDALKEELSAKNSEFKDLTAQAKSSDDEVQALEKKVSHTEKSLAAEKAAREHDLRTFSNPGNFSRMLLTEQGIEVAFKKTPDNYLSEENFYRLLGGVLESFFVTKVPPAVYDIREILLKNVSQRYFIDAEGQRRNGFKLIENVLKLQRMNAAIRQESSVLQTGLSTVSNEFGQLKKESELLKNEYKQLQTQYGRLEKILGESNAQHNEFLTTKGLYEKLKTEHNQLQEQYDSLCSEKKLQTPPIITPSLGATDANISPSTESEYLAKMASLSEHLTVLSTTNFDLVNLVTHLSAQRKSDLEKNAEFTEQLTSLAQEKRSIEQAYNDLTLEAEGIRSANASLNKDLKKFFSSKKNEWLKKGGLKKDIYKAMEEDLATTQASYEEVAAKLNNLRSQYDTLSLEILSAIADKARAVTERDAALLKSADYDKLRSEMDSAYNEIKRKTQKLKELEQQVKTFGQDNSKKPVQLQLPDYSLSECTEILAKTLGKEVSPSQLVEAYVRSKISLVRDSAVRYDQMRAGASVRNVSDKEILVELLADNDLEVKSLEDLLEKIADHKRPFEETPEYAKLHKDCLLAEKRLEKRSQYLQELNELEEMKSDDDSWENIYAGLNDLIHKINPDEEKEKIRSFDEKKEAYDLARKKYLGFEQKLADNNQKKDSAASLEKDIEDVKNQGLGTILFINYGINNDGINNDGINNDNYTVSFSLPFDESIKSSSLLIDATQCVFNPELLSLIYGTSFSESASNEHKAHIPISRRYDIKCSNGLMTINYSVPITNLVSITSKPGSLSSKDSEITEESKVKMLAELQEKILLQIEKSYAGSGMPQMGFSLRVLTLNELCLNQHYITGLLRIIENQGEKNQGEGNQGEGNQGSRNQGVETQGSVYAPDALVDVNALLQQSPASKRPAVVNDSEKLYRFFRNAGIALNKPYRGSKETAKELIDFCVKNADELGILLQPEQYNTKRASESSLLWNIIEVEIAKQGDDFRAMGEYIAQIKTIFPDYSQDKICSDIRNAIAQLTERHCLDAFAEEGQSRNKYRSSIYRPQTADISDQTATSTFNQRYYSPFSKEELEHIIAENSELHTIAPPYSNDTEHNVLKNLVYYSITGGASRAGEIADKIKFFFPNITYLSEINSAIRLLEKKGFIKSQKDGRNKIYSIDDTSASINIPLADDVTILNNEGD